MVVIYHKKRYTIGRYVPNIWKKTYDVGRCPYDAYQNDPEIDVKDKDKKLIRAIISRKSTLFPKTNEQKIPRLIIQTNEDDYIPESMFAATSTVLDKNPNYDYVYFDNKRAREYIRSNYDLAVLDAYDSLIPGAYKADLFRYCVLYIKGGVYIDMGMICLTSLDDVIGHNDTFISPEDNGTSGLYNAFMCCEPLNPIVGEAIRLCVLNIQNRDYTNSPLGITGPLLLSKAFENITGFSVKVGRYVDGIKILSHFKLDECPSGEIYGSSINTGREIRIISTRSPTYRRDQKWYNRKPRYTDLWNAGQVYVQ